MKLVLGSAQFGMRYGIVNESSVVSKSELKDLLDFAFASGINEIDTAISYGVSEENLGAVGVDSFLISTKVPFVESYKPGDIERYLSGSLRRLNKACIDTLYLHDDRNSANALLVSELQYLKESGRIRRVGVSTYLDHDFVAQLASYQTFDVIQCPGNVLDEKYQQIDKTLFEVVLRSVFLQGLLLCEVSKLPSFVHQHKLIFMQWEQYCLEHGMSKLEMCLYNALRQDISALVVGVTSLPELQQIIEAINAISEISDVPLFRCDEVPKILTDPRKWNK